MHYHSIFGFVVLRLLATRSMVVHGPRVQPATLPTRIKATIRKVRIKLAQDLYGSHNKKRRVALITRISTAELAGLLAAAEVVEETSALARSEDYVLKMWLYSRDSGPGNLGVLGSCGFRVTVSHVVLLFGNRAWLDDRAAAG